MRAPRVPACPRAPGTRQRLANGVRCTASRWHLKITAFRSVPMAPGPVGRPGRTQPPCGRDRSRCRQSRRPRAPARLWPPSPQLVEHVNIRACCRSPRRVPKPYTRARTDRSAQRTCRFERRPRPAPPPRSTLPLSRASLAGNQPAWGASISTCMHTSADYQYVSLSVTASMEGNRARSGTWVEGLDHWSSGVEDHTRRPDGPFLTSPPRPGRGTRANTEQT